MNTCDSLGTSLRNTVSLLVPGSPVASMTVFAPHTKEESLPFPSALAKGEIKAVHAGSELGIMSAALTSGERRFVARIHTPGRPLRFSFVLAPGATTASLDGERQGFQISGGQSAVLSVPSAVANVVPPHTRIRNLCILAERSLVEACLRDDLAGAPAGLLRALEEHAEPYSHISVITPQMQIVVDQILSSPYTGGLKRLYLEAKCLELVAMRLAQLCAEEPRRRHPRLRRADVDCIHEARDVLIEHSANPPSLRDVALMVGVNCNKLKYGFREVFGTTVFGYLRNIRLEQARELLAAGDCSVTEVAYQVGYNSLSHFARIFRETYGVSPHLYPTQDRFQGDASAGIVKELGGTDIPHRRSGGAGDVS